MKIYEIVQSKEILDSLAQNKKLPTKIAYKIYRLLTKVTPSLDFYNNQKFELFRKYGNQEGKDIVIPKENQEAFLKDLNELKQVECEDEIEKIDISLDIDLGISPADFFLLEPFINFVE